MKEQEIGIAKIEKKVEYSKYYSWYEITKNWVAKIEKENTIYMYIIHIYNTLCFKSTKKIKKNKMRVPNW